jgi:metal-responsive CopG/Arc/MetJ family transcriptional regulator
MPGVKTAISIDKELFDSVNKLAQTMKVSRSRLISLAVQDYLKKQENMSLLARLNDVYADESLAESTIVSEKKQSIHRKIIEREQW